MAPWVEDGALPLPVGKILRLADNDAAVAADALAQGTHVVNSKHHGLRCRLTVRSDAAMTDIGHDQTALAEGQLRSVTRSDPDALDKSQHVDQPVHRGGNIRIGELRDHRTERGGAIRSHRWKRTPRHASRWRRSRGRLRSRVAEGRVRTLTRLLSPSSAIRFSLPWPVPHPGLPRTCSQISEVIRSASRSWVRWKLRPPRAKVFAIASGTSVSLNERGSHVVSRT